MKKTVCLLLMLQLVLVGTMGQTNFSIQKGKDGFELFKEDKPFYVKGIGGSSNIELAKENGANAFRTWGGSVASINREIEKARTNDMYIMQGIHLTKDSAAYFDDSYKSKVREEITLLAETFKNEDRILAWGVGNEIDLGNANIPEAWQFVEEIAQLIKSIDKNHLVATVIAFNQQALNYIEQYAPSIDYVGINAYGAIVELNNIVRKSDYKGPIMVTEWGPTGFWEVASTSWGAPIEQTSEEKRVVYEERYTQYIQSDPRCLGSFVFLWGQKEERTPTWFSMFVEDKVEGLPIQGEKTPMVEAMQRVWSGKEPAQTAPVVDLLTIEGKSAFDNVTLMKKNFTASVKANDKEQKELTYVWEILKEATVLGFGGSKEPRPDRVGEVITTNNNQGNFTVKDAGNYRLYVYVLDNTGFVGTANIPFQIK